MYVHACVRACMRMHTYIHTLHCIALHYITLHHNTLQYITLHYITLFTLHYNITNITNTSSTAQGGGGSFKNRKPMRGWLL